MIFSVDKRRAALYNMELSLKNRLALPFPLCGTRRFSPTVC